MKTIQKKDHEKLLRGTGNKLKPGEADAVLSRLAAGEVNSAAANRISSEAEQHKTTILNRINDTIDVYDPEEVYSNLVALFQNADLTINFRPRDLFLQMSPDQYYNVFERDKDKTDKSETGMRIAAEEPYFQYRSPGNNFNNVQEVIDRIRRSGNYDSGRNPSFAPGMRPKYGGLNILNLKTGAASMYGNSHMILRDFVKDRCTITSSDSTHFLRNDPQSHLANIFNPEKVISELSPDTFRNLCSRVTTGQEATGLPHDLVYIEAQIHSEILFGRDVKMICLDKKELCSGTDDGIAIAENIALLANKYDIRIQEFN